MPTTTLPDPNVVPLDETPNQRAARLKRKRRLERIEAGTYQRARDQHRLYVPGRGWVHIGGNCQPDPEDYGHPLADVRAPA